MEQQCQSQRTTLGDAGQAVDIVEPEGENTAAQDGQQSVSDKQTNHSFPKRLPELSEKVKKWKNQEADMDKTDKLGQGNPKETIENGCHIWYNYSVILWKHNRKEL